MSSRFEPQAWQIPGQSSWDQHQSNSGAGSPMQGPDDHAFETQIEEIERARENLIQSGKPFGGPPRRDSMPMMGGQRPYSDYADPRMGGMASRNHPIGDYDQMRPHSGSSLQNFYANQRHQAPRQSEADQMQQAKRRMAAQRERELRNYHQEQQYNRNVSVQGKSDRAISPNTMNEDDRRELIARQHRALYGSEGASVYESNKSSDNNPTPRPMQSGAASGGRGPSPRTFDPFNRGQNQPQSAVGEPAGPFNHSEQVQQGTTGGPSPSAPQQRSRANSNSSPASNQQGFSLFDNNAQQSSRTSTSSPGESSGQQGKTSAPTSAGVAPIGTRPAPSQAAHPALSKRSTTPLPSPLSYGFAPNEGPSTTSSANERSTSAASNPSAGAKDSSMGVAWGSGSGVWGKNPLGVQASVWG